VNVENPLQLFFLFILVPVVFLAVQNYRRGKIFRGHLTGSGEGHELFGIFFVKVFLGTLFFCVFLVFSVLALAGISWGTAPEPEDKSGLDIVIAIDVSRSMLATDSPPSRLRAAADISLGLVQSLHRSRFAVVAFKGDALLAIPMTEDRQILDVFFREISPSVVSAPGTNLEAGLGLSINAFPSGIPGHRAIVLLSDGESLSDFPAGSAEKAKKEGIPVYTVGMGGEEGAVIRVEGGGLVSGRDGKPVVTRRSAGILKTIAEVSQGEYFSCDEPGIISRLTQELQDFEASRGRMGFRLAPVRRYRGFLLAGFLFLIAAVLARSIRWKRK